MFTQIRFLAGAGSFDLQGNRIRTTGIVNASSNLQRVSLDVQIPVNVTLNGGASGLHLAGAISQQGSLRGINTSGLVILSAANTYGGLTRVTSGTLEVRSNNALGLASGTPSLVGTKVDNGASLLLDNVSYTTTEPLEINGTGSGGGGSLINRGVSSFSGAVTAATSSTVHAGSGTLALMGGLVHDGTSISFTGGGRVNIGGAGLNGATLGSGVLINGTALVLNATSGNNGPTTVTNNGTLVANTVVSTGQIDVQAGSSMAGSGSISASTNQFIYLNGALVIGDSTLGSPVASSLELATSGTGSTIVGGSGTLAFDLFIRGGDLSGNATSADYLRLFGALDTSAGGSLILGNPNALSTFAAGDKWRLLDLASGTISHDLAINATALNLGSGLTGSFDRNTGIFSIIALAVPEPSRAMLVMLGLSTLGMRRHQRLRAK